MIELPEVTRNEVDESGFLILAAKTTHIRFEILDHEKIEKTLTVSMIIDEIEKMRT